MRDVELCVCVSVLDSGFSFASGPWVQAFIEQLGFAGAQLLMCGY